MYSRTWIVVIEIGTYDGLYLKLPKTKAYD